MAFFSVENPLSQKPVKKKMLIFLLHFWLDYVPYTATQYVPSCQPFF
jgi:hypothetical protein